MDGTDPGEASDTTLYFDGLGAGVTCYIMPVNIYLAGSVGVRWVSLTICEAEWFVGNLGTSCNCPPTTSIADCPRDYLSIRL